MGKQPLYPHVPGQNVETRSLGLVPGDQVEFRDCGVKRLGVVTQVNKYNAYVLVGKTTWLIEANSIKKR